MTVIGYLVVGAGEGDRYLEAVLRQLHWTDGVAVCLNNADEKTAEIAARYAKLIVVDNRTWGLEQWRIKQDFLAKVIEKLQPDWIWCLDADEAFDPRFDRAMAEKMASGEDIAWYFWCLQLWNGEDRVRMDLSFPNIRFYKVRPELGLHFHAQALHCGLAPRYAYRFGSQSGLYFKHYGLMLREDRQRKIARYDKYDPKAAFKGKSWYDGLRNEKAASLTVEEAISRIPDFIYRNKPVKAIQNMAKDRQIFMFLNKHGKAVEAVGEKQRDQFVKMGFKPLEAVKINKAPEAAVVPPEQEQEENEAEQDAGDKPSETDDNEGTDVEESAESEPSAGDAPKRTGSGKTRGGKKGARGARS